MQYYVFSDLLIQLVEPSSYYASPFQICLVTFTFGFLSFSENFFRKNFVFNRCNLQHSNNMKFGSTNKQKRYDISNSSNKTFELCPTSMMKVFATIFINFSFRMQKSILIRTFLEGEGIGGSSDPTHPPLRERKFELRVFE